ncbi:MAG: glycosyltransferase family 39 protein [Bacteroidota bacterium]
MNSHISRHLTFFFFGTVLVVGLWILPDYGVSWDEDIQRQHGRVAWDYVNEKLGIEAERMVPEHEFRSYEYNFHGTLFQMVNQLIEDGFDLRDYREYNLLRHYTIFGLFYLGLIVFFLTLREHFGKTGIALLGAAMLVLSPRIFGNAFFNTKDIVLMSTFIFAMYSLVKFIDKRNLKWAILHAVFCALAVNARLLGIYVTVFSLLLIILELAQNKSARTVRFWINIATYTFLTAALTIALWPYLWENTLENFFAAFELLSKYSWDGDMRYFNTWVNSQDLPWHYGLAWIHISTPIVYLIFIWLGVILACRMFIRNLLRKKKFYQDNAGRNITIFFGCSVVPLAIIVLKDSVIYDSWRHLFFVYPGLLILGLLGFEAARKRLEASRLRNLPAIMIGMSLMTTLAFTVFNHPFQHTYINIPDDELEKRFDIDYWGVSYYEALNQLAEADHRDTIIVNMTNYPGFVNVSMLPLEKRNRFKRTFDRSEADYLLTNFRFKAGLQPYLKNQYPMKTEDEFLSLSTSNSKVIGVYRLHGKP